MTREQIEKAWKEHTLYNPSFEDDISLNEKQAFVKGAQWRINSVWHDMETEVPQVYGEYKDSIYPQIPCLVVGHLSTGYGYGVRYWNVTEQCWDDEECDDYECDKNAVEKWCYLDDLIPNTEG